MVAVVKQAIKSLINGISAESERQRRGEWLRAGRRPACATRSTLLRHPQRLWREHRPWAIGLIAGVVVLVVGVVVAYNSLKRPGDVHNQEAIERFEPQKPEKPVRAKTVNWPVFGYDRARTRYLPAKGIKPPFDKLWRYTNRPLLEFPPIYVAGRLYAVNNNGTPSRSTPTPAKSLWERRIGRLNASSPAYYRHRLYIVNLVPGHIVKLDAKTGQDDLETRAAGPGRVLAAGDRPHRLLRLRERRALRAQHGQRQRALDDLARRPDQGRAGLLRRQALRRRLRRLHERGRRQERQADLAERLAGPGIRRLRAFYSTPAVAFGRVYAGNNDGRVYSYDSGDGTLAWSYSTGGYAYSGPAVATTRHSPPTVFIGSFDGNVYALDAKDGSLRWSRGAGGQVIGSLSAVGDIVYVAEFTHKSTSGFMMRSGRRVFRYPKGTYTPVISDGRRIYLTGYSSITALQPHRAVVGVAAGAPGA